MKIETEYLRSLMIAAQGSDKPTFSIMDFLRAGLSYSDVRFEFHMRILGDQRLLERDDGTGGIGISKTAEGSAHWLLAPLRLTASGHQFLEALSNPEVWAVIRRDYVQASAATLQSAALKLLMDHQAAAVTRREALGPVDSSSAEDPKIER